MPHFKEQYRDIRKPDGEVMTTWNWTPIAELPGHLRTTANSPTLRTVCVFIIKLKKPII